MFILLQPTVTVPQMRGGVAVLHVLLKGQPATAAQRNGTDQGDATLGAF